MFSACFCGSGHAPQARPSLRRRISRRFRKYISKEQNEETISHPQQREEYPSWNDDEDDLSQRRLSVRDSQCTFALSKHEDYLMDPSVHSIQMGLGWDEGVDADASTAMFDEKLQLVDTVWYKKLKSSCGSVVHSGDNVTGAGEGDDETVAVQLSDIPLHVHHLLFVVCVFSYDVSFRQIRSAFVRIVHSKERQKQHELCRFTLQNTSGRAMVMGALTRKGPCWSFRALGIPAVGHNALEVLRNPRSLDCLSECQSWKLELRHVTVSVVKGSGLTASDGLGNGWNAASTCNPYFLMKFRRKHFTSEYKSQTSEPEWNGQPLQLGWITEAESKALKVQVFDNDPLNTDGFLGMVEIPGRDLFDLGPGEHAYWFQLGGTNAHPYRRNELAGRILIRIRIEESTTRLQEVEN